MVWFYFVFLISLSLFWADSIQFCEILGLNNASIGAHVSVHSLTFAVNPHVYAHAMDNKQFNIPAPQIYARRALGLYIK